MDREPAPGRARGPSRSPTRAGRDGPVAGFYYDRGVDVRERAVRAFPSVADDRVAITGRDPFRARVTYGADGDEVALLVDGSLDVVAVTRDRRGDSVPGTPDGTVDRRSSGTARGRRDGRDGGRSCRSDRARIAQ